MLTQAQHDAVRQAVAEAESRTTGEIFCVVAKKCGHYREVSLAWAAAVALVGPAIGLALGFQPAAALATALDWWAVGLSPTLSLWVYAALQGGLFLLVWGLASIPTVQAWLAPASLKRAHVHQRAMEQFLAQGLHETPDHTGVLIFVSAFERRMEVIADEGIHAKVGDETWDKAVAAALPRIKTGDAAGGLVAAIQVCGAVLAKHFPADGLRANRLPDDVVEV